MATIKEIREGRKILQADLAIQAGISVKTLSRIENGYSVNRGTLKLIAAALGVDVTEISGVNIRGYGPATPRP